MKLTDVRIVALLGLGLGMAACLPLTPFGGTDPVQSPTTLGVSVQAPSADATLPQGDQLEVRWTGYNATGLSATARLWAESRTDLSQIVLVDALPIVGAQTTTTTWDTTGVASGQYVLRAQISTPDETRSAASAGTITIDAPATFAFTQPAGSVSVQQGSDLTLAWTGADPEAKAAVSIGLDSDTNHDSGNERVIHEVTLPAESTETTFTWGGNDASDEPVETGTWYLFARIDDTVNPEQIVTSDAIITITPADGGNQPPAFGITSPAEDTTFLTTAASLEIKFRVNQLDDVLIDLNVDTDDNHQNGNEQKILSQRLVAGGTQEDTFTWTGTLTDGTPLAPGIYRIFVVMSTGADTPQTAEGPGLVFRRETADQPLVGLLQPEEPVTVKPGEFVTIRWRDDDPGEQAQIRLALDDDPRPAEGEPGTADDKAEQEIVKGRQAAPDGQLQDSYIWQVPGTLAPGTYYVFAYIAVNASEPGGATGSEQFSVAPGLIIISDPSKP